MDNGERISLEVLSKLIDLGGGVGKGVISLGAKVTITMIHKKNVLQQVKMTLLNLEMVVNH